MQKYGSPSNVNTHGQDIVTKMVDYWGEGSTVSPNKQQATRNIKGIDGILFKATHPKHHVDGTQTDFFRGFLKRHPELKGKVGQRTLTNTNRGLLREDTGATELLAHVYGTVALNCVSNLLRSIARRLELIFNL